MIHRNPCGVPSRFVSGDNARDLKMPTDIRYRFVAVSMAAAFALHLAPIQVHGQQVGRLSGNVSDAITGDPVADVMVSVLGSTIAVGTDTEGRYSIDSVAPGLIRIMAQLLGYVPITTDYYTVFPDTTVDVDFKLAPVAYELDPVRVTGANPAREWHHVQGAQLLTKEQLPPQGDILNAIHGLIPGVRTRGRHEDTRLVVRGAEADVIYVVDGKVIRPPLTFRIDVADVACIEVRKGFRAVMEYKPSMIGPNYAGVVLIFTDGYIGARPSGCGLGGE